MSKQKFAQDKLDCIKKVNDMTTPQSSQTTVNVNEDENSLNRSAGNMGAAIGTLLGRAFGSDPGQEIFELCMEARGWYQVDKNGQRIDR